MRYDERNSKQSRRIYLGRFRTDPARFDLNHPIPRGFTPEPPKRHRFRLPHASILLVDTQTRWVGIAETVEFLTL